MFRSNEGRKIKINFDPFAKGFSSQELTDTFYKLTCEPRQALLILESIGFNEVDAEYNEGELTCQGCIGECGTCGNRGRDMGMVMESVRVKAYSRTTQTMAALQRSLNKYMKDKDLSAGEATIGKPKKSGLFATVTVQFPVSDGQTISIIFHSPDNNKMMITASDEILAFRWLLNKRDITVAVSPEGEADVSLEEVGKRVAMLVEKNAVRFAATQKDIVEAKKTLDDLKSGVNTEQANNATVLSQLHEMQVQGEALDNQIAMSTDKLQKIQDFNAGLQAQIDSLATQKAANEGKAKGEGEKTPEQIQADSELAEYLDQRGTFESELVGRGFNSDGDIFTYETLRVTIIGPGIREDSKIGVRIQAERGNQDQTLTYVGLKKGQRRFEDALEWVDSEIKKMKDNGNDEAKFAAAYQLFEDILGSMGFSSRGTFKYHIGLVGSRNGKPALEEVSASFFVDSTDGKVVVNADKSTFKAQSKATASNAFDKAITVLQERLKDRMTVDQWAAQYQSTVNKFHVGDEYKVSRRTVSPSFEIDSYMDGYKVINVNSTEHGGSQLPSIQFDSDNSSMNIRYDLLQEYLDTKILVPEDGEVDVSGTNGDDIASPAIQTLDDILAGKYPTSDEILPLLEQAGADLEAAGMSAEDEAKLGAAADYLTTIMDREAA